MSKTLIDAWEAGRIQVPWELLAKSNRQKLFNARREDAAYYLIGGTRPTSNRQDNYQLVILEVLPDGKGHIITDTPGRRSEGFSEVFRSTSINIDTLRQALGYSQDVQEPQEPPAGQTYNPSTHYTVKRFREGAGRPRRVLTEQEQANISLLRAQGMSINAISQQLGINNRRVMEYCKKL